MKDEETRGRRLNKLKTLLSCYKVQRAYRNSMPYLFVRFYQIKRTIYFKMVVSILFYETDCIVTKDPIFRLVLWPTFLIKGSEAYEITMVFDIGLYVRLSLCRLMTFESTLSFSRNSAESSCDWRWRRRYIFSHVFLLKHCERYNSWGVCKTCTSHSRTIQFCMLTYHQRIKSF
jgi:hypothetical protein